MNQILGRLFIAVFCYLGITACSQDIKNGSQKVLSSAILGQPVEFDFRLCESHGETRSSTPLPVDKVVYVTPDQGITFFSYRFDETEERWKCTDPSNPLTWSSVTMNIWAFVGNNGTSVSTIAADQAVDGYEDSDFLASYGSYSFSNGVLQMKLDHKVARLMVKVTGSLDPSMLTCTTNSAFPTSANIVLGENSVSLSGGESTALFKLYRRTFEKDDNAANNTTYFTAYMMPNDAFSTSFTLKCATLTYTTQVMSVPLKAGQTSQIDITLPVIKKEWNYDVTTSGRNEAHNIGNSQEFIAPISGYYKLEVWGAEGGSYQYTKEGLAFSDYDLQMKGISMCKGGTGAYVTGKIYLKKDTKLYIYVGKAGIQDVDSAVAVSDATYPMKFSGGWNGGGHVWMMNSKSARTSKVQDDAVNASRQLGGGGGGGATDIALQSAAWDDPKHLYSRIIVAGGGGGGCYTPDQPGWYDGGGGGGSSTWEGEEGGHDTTAGIQSLGGTLTQCIAANGAGAAGSNNICQYSYNGGFGFGGGGGWSGESIGGGGGGWYGGTAGTGSGTNGAGGGGSSYAYTKELLYPGTSNTIASYYPTTYKDQDNFMPNDDFLLTDVTNLPGSYVQTVVQTDWSTTTIEGARSEAWKGHGHARITLLLE